jgi:hypothetical protein
MIVWTMKGGFRCTKPIVQCLSCAARRVASSDDVRLGLKYEPLSPAKPNVVLSSDVVDFM